MLFVLLVGNYIGNNYIIWNMKNNIILLFFSTSWKYFWNYESREIIL